MPKECVVPAEACLSSFNPPDITKFILEDVIRNEAADFVYWPTTNKGYYTSHVLRLIADYLDNQNRQAEKERTLMGPDDLYEKTKG